MIRLACIHHLTILRYELKVHKFNAYAVNFITSQINVSLSSAAMNAQSHVGNASHPVAGNLDVINGYLTYNICVIDSNMNLHSLGVDAGNGKVLSYSIISLQKMGMFNHMMGPMMNPNMMDNVTGTR